MRAAKADKMSPKSLASPEVLAGILDAKFVMGLPVYRLEQQLARDGGQLARQTIYGWMIRRDSGYRKGGQAGRESVQSVLFLGIQHQ